MTTLVRRMPLSDLDAIERRLQRTFGELFTPLTSAALPAADVYETPDEYVVELEVPGYEGSELEIQVSDHTVTVKGERRIGKEEEEKTFWLRERLEREFERRFALPAGADTEHVEAAFKQGVLEVRTPKLQTVGPRTVEITRGA